VDKFPLIHNAIEARSPSFPKAMALRRELADSVLPMGSGLGIVAPPPLHIAAPAFEGSLATLLKCVRDHKVDLRDIPLAPVCEAYFEYLLSSATPDLDEAAAALVALAYLLERKAWVLLPVDDPEPEVEEPLELPDPTVHEYDLAIEALKIWHEERSRVYFRSPEAGPDPYELPYTLANVKADDLARALERLLSRAVPAKVESLSKPRKTLSEVMRLVLSALTSTFKPLEELITAPYTREDAVYWFLAILELIRLGRVNVQADEQEVRFASA
jgi:segregation and condensation protein A